MPTSIDRMNTPRAHLSRAELKLYASGELPHAQQHALEMHLEQCALCAEAVEGFVLVPTSGALDDLQWNEKGSGGSSGKIVRGMLLAAVLIAGVWVAWYYGGAMNDRAREVEHTPLIEKFDHAPGLMSQAQETELVEAIGSARELPEHELIGVITSDEELEGSTTLARIDERIADAKLIDTMEPRPIGVNRASMNKEPASNSSKKRNSRNLIYLHDMKIVDPQEIYPQGGLLQVKTRSISADRANEEDRDDPLATRQQSVPYLQVMDRALGKIASQDHKSALWEMVILLEAHPKDVNALFYAGLCYYNLGMFDRASLAFDKVKQDPIDTFREPADWYQALTTERLLGREASAKMYRDIAAGRGFYAAQAITRLKGPTP